MVVDRDNLDVVRKHVHTLLTPRLWGVQVYRHPRRRYPVLAGITIRFSSWWALLLSIVFVVVMANVSGRLLGVRPSGVRGLVASVLGWLVGLSGAAVIAQNQSQAVVFTLAVLFAALATMLFSIVIETLSRPRTSRTGRRVGRGVLHPLRWTREAVPDNQVLAGDHVRPRPRSGPAQVRLSRSGLDE